MNKVVLIGRLTRDAEVRYSQNGDSQTAIARFTVAVDRRQKQGDQPSADFIQCVAFGKNAEFFEKYGNKGVKFGIEGRIQTGNYTNKDGQKVYTTDVVVESQEFVESKNTAAQDAPAPAPTSNGANGYVDIPDNIDDDLPFN
ncbi:MAG: single-stranded DNA-binding protein [Lachnospiraceae bacterium]|nr:single-stranded DNA-binding protein [Lachnospiraceae bacterium]